MEIDVNLYNLKSTADDMRTYSRELGRCIEQLKSIKNSMPLKMKGGTAFNTDLMRMITKLDNDKKSVESLREALENCGETYSLYEKEIVENFAPGNNGGKTKNNRKTKVRTDEAEDETKKEKYKPNMWDLVKEVVGEVGIVGGISNTAWSTISDVVDKNYGKAAIDAAKGIIKYGEKIYSAGKSDAGWWKAAFGIENYEKQSFWEAFGENFIVKTEGKDGAKILSKGKTVVKWAGYLLTVASKGIDNYQEFGGFSERAVGETVIESGVDITLSAAVGAGLSATVGAGLAAAGVTAGAIPILIGGGTVVVVWGIDEGFKYFNDGKGIGETAADFYYDTALPAAKKLKKTVSDGLEKVGNSAKRAVKNTVKAGWARVTSIF